MRQHVDGTHRRVDFVAHTANIDHQLRRLFFFQQFAGEVSNHEGVRKGSRKKERPIIPGNRV